MKKWLGVMLALAIIMALFVPTASADWVGDFNYYIGVDGRIRYAFVTAYVGTSPLVHLRVPSSIEYTSGDASEDAFFGSYCPVRGVSLNAFKGQKDLLDATLYGSSIGASAFADCTALKWVDADSISTIEASAFSGCTSLESVRLSNYLTEIKACTFDGCSALKCFTLPSALKTIGTNAFRGCTALETVVVPEEMALTDGIVSAFGDVEYEVEYGSAAHEYALEKGLRYRLGTIYFNSVTAEPDFTLWHNKSKPHQLNLTLEPQVDYTQLKPQQLTFESSDPTVATVSEDGLVTPVGPGQAVLTIHAYYHTDTVTVTVAPYAVESIIAEDDFTLALGKSHKLSVSSVPAYDFSTFEAGQFQYESSDESVATVSGDGTVKSVAPGQTIITVSDRDDPFVNDTVTVTVEDKRGGPLGAFVDVTWEGDNATEAVFEYGAQAGLPPYDIEVAVSGWQNETENLTGQTSDINGVYYTRTFEMPTLVQRTYRMDITVTDAAGNTASASGYVSRTSREVGTGRYTTYYKTDPVTGRTISVREEITETVWSTSSRSGYSHGSSVMNRLRVASLLSGHPGESLSLECVVTPDRFSDDVIFESEDPSVAGVDEAGTVTLNAVGRTNVWTYAVDGSGLMARTEVLCLNQRVSAIELSAPNPVDKTDCTQQLVATIQPEEADFKELRWSSSDETVATVDQNGDVTWLAPGEVVITAASTDGSDVEQSISLSWEGILAESLELLINSENPMKLSWRIEPENVTNPAVTFQVDKPSLLTINEIGVMTFLGDGEATVRARTQDGSNLTADLKVTTHKYGEPEYSWSDDMTTLTAVCACENHPDVTLTEAVEVKRTVWYWPTERVMGWSNYKSERFKCSLFTPMMKSLQDIPVLGELSALKLPSGLRVIEDEAFYGGDFERIIVPNGCASIGSRAFADCKRLIYVNIPSTVTEIAEDAFEGCPYVKLDRE